jgi:hypothetical protein
MAWDAGTLGVSDADVTSMARELRRLHGPDAEVPSLLEVAGNLEPILTVSGSMLRAKPCIAVCRDTRMPMAHTFRSGPIPSDGNHTPVRPGISPSTSTPTLLASTTLFRAASPTPT